MRTTTPTSTRFAAGRPCGNARRASWPAPQPCARLSACQAANVTDRCSPLAAVIADGKPLTPVRFTDVARFRPGPQGSLCVDCLASTPRRTEVGGLLGPSRCVRAGNDARDKALEVAGAAFAAGHSQLAREGFYRRSRARRGRDEAPA